MDYPKFLGLKREEKLILSTLSKCGILSVSEISKNTKIPRTTIYNHIKSLSSRELITTRKDKKENLIISKYKHHFSTQSSEEFDISNKDGFTKAYTLIQQHKNQSRIRWIQPSGVLKIIIEKYSIDEIIHINNMIKKSGMVIECILEEDYYQSLQKLLSVYDYTKITNSLYGRPYESYLIEKDILDPYTEILLFGNGVVILNWKYFKGIYTQNQAVNLFFESHFRQLRDKSKKINVSEILVNKHIKN